MHSVKHQTMNLFVLVSVNQVKSRSGKGSLMSLWDSVPSSPPDVSDSSQRAQRNIPAHLWDSVGSFTYSHWTPVRILQELKRLTWHKMRGLVVLVTLACFASAQHQALIDYLERRLLAIEVRLTLPSCRALGSRVPLKGNFQGQGIGNEMQMWVNPGKILGNWALTNVWGSRVRITKV